MKLFGIGVLVVLSVSMAASAAIEFNSNLVLDITDPSCVMLRNEGDTMIEFSMYEIYSDAGLLNPSGFLPMLDRDMNPATPMSPGDQITLIEQGNCLAGWDLWTDPLLIGERDGTCTDWGLLAGAEVCLGDIGGTATVDDLTFYLGGMKGVVVPEPASMALLVIGGMAVLRKRR